MKKRLLSLFMILVLALSICSIDSNAKVTIASYLKSVIQDGVIGSVTSLDMNLNTTNLKLTFQTRSEYGNVTQILHSGDSWAFEEDIKGEEHWRYLVKNYKKLAKKQLKKKSHRRKYIKIMKIMIKKIGADCKVWTATYFGNTEVGTTTDISVNSVFNLVFEDGTIRDYDFSKIKKV